MKKEVIEALNTIKTFLGMEKEVKLAQMMLVDGKTKIEAEEFEVGYPVNVIAEDGTLVPLPASTEPYELEDGRFLVVSEDGIIGELKEAPMGEEEAPMEQPTPEVPVEAEAQTEERQPKRVVESKEYHFSKEEVQALKDEIENLKKEIIELRTEKHVDLTDEQPTDVVEFSDVKPIQFNPENEELKEPFFKGNDSGLSNILSKVYKLN